MSNLEYPKIDTLYDRDEKHAIMVEKLRRPEFELIKRFQITEKINGRNTRITLFDDGEVVFGGKTDNADIPSELIKYLIKTFTPEKMQNTFWGDPEKIPKSVTLYGEGYGAKMSSGSGIYRRGNDVSFRLFDCFIEEWWLERENLEDIASKLEIKCVPIIATIDFLPKSASEIHELFYNVKDLLVASEEGNYSNTTLQLSPPEGIVAKTVPLLFNRKGEKVMWKLKIKDFKKEK